jgi:Arc/MetJ-type ribon-helix-helix transcriptional regulator
MTISFPDSVKALIEERAAKSGYASSAEYLLSLVERDRNRAFREEIEAKLAEAVAAPSAPMTREDWDDIRREGMKIIAARKAQ